MRPSTASATASAHEPEERRDREYASNALPRSPRISFMNEIADAVRTPRAGEVEQVRIAVGSEDVRIGRYAVPLPWPSARRQLLPEGFCARSSHRRAARVRNGGFEAAVRANEAPKMLLGHMDRELGGFSGKVIRHLGLASSPAPTTCAQAPAQAHPRARQARRQDSRRRPGGCSKPRGSGSSRRAT